MKILIIGINYAPEEIGIGPYTANLSEWLAARGNRVTAVVGKPYYPEWRGRPGPRGFARSCENGVTVIRCPHYIPSRPSGPKRIAHHLSFALTALVAAWRESGRERFDRVVFVAPALLAAPAALLAARRSRVPAWLHIQDFELEAALATGLLGGTLARRLGGWIERRLIGGFAQVSSISAAMVAKAIAKGVPASRACEVRNWADLETVGPDCDSTVLRAELGLPAGHLVAYSGNLALKQGIGVIAEAARLLADRQDIQFLVCGEGSGRDAFAAAVSGLGNVHLRPLQPRGRLGELLAAADLHVLPQIAEAADLVLPSKLANMLASGRPVIATAAPGSALADEVAGCGLAVAPGDANALAAAIVRLIDDPDERRRLGEAARERALQRWSRDAILSGFGQRLATLTPGLARAARFEPS
jgi:colanic acid biosynthesis glycosyl transferase WcaI